ncbi:MAG TPA: glycosyl hydrolase family 65 protein [Anaerolineales bacterium]|nr:glycosyl hydrolase family 65 protein [Anaerolineales bacterium]
MAKVADKYLLVDPWKIIEAGFHPEKSKVSEALFSLGNEYQGVRGYFDEGYSGDSLVGCYLNGIYEERFLREPSAYKGISSRICFMVNTVNWLYTRIELDGETLDLAKYEISDFRQELDFRTGELHREFIWTTTSGKKLKLVFSRFLSMRVKELAFQRIVFKALNFSGPVRVTQGLDFSILHRSFQENFWECPQKSERAILGVSKSIRHKLFAGFEIQSGAPKEVENIREEKFVGCRFSLDLLQGNDATIDKLNVLATSRDPAQPEAEAWAAGKKLLAEHRSGSYTGFLQRNAEYWAHIWDRFDITIDGDPDTQQGIRFCIFQMQQTYRGIVDGANIGAKGLTGDDYNGNAFWDSETYCLPFFLFSNPQAAKSLIDFRYRTLPQALDRARQLDCEGACFPVATTDGTESCTLWQHASLQFQPTTAVAYAIWHYAKVIGDAEFLYSEGIELLIHICRFLASRGQWSPRRNQFGYYAVMGPDEFQMMVNNSCYTNLMAKRTFEYTLEVLAEMDEARPEKKADLIHNLACTSAELGRWKEMAEKMIIPRDPQTGIYEEHEGFFDLPHIDPDSIPVEDFPLYYNWSYDRIYRNDVIKQPDVLMFMFLYNQSFSLAEKQANYDYYEPRCIHESSLSPSVHSILAAELGRPQEAFEFFRFATRIDLDNYNRNTGEGIHTTSIAAAWMNIVYGFGGMRSDGESLSFHPTIPEHWKAYSFQVLYHGSVIRVDVRQKNAKIRIVEGKPVPVRLLGELREIGPEGLDIPV